MRSGPHHGWGEPIRTLVFWRQGSRHHPTRNECMGWFAQIPSSRLGWTNPYTSFLGARVEATSKKERVYVLVRPNPLITCCYDSDGGAIVATPPPCSPVYLKGASLSIYDFKFWWYVRCGEVFFFMFSNFYKLDLHQQNLCVALANLWWSIDMNRFGNWVSFDLVMVSEVHVCGFLNWVYIGPPNCVY